MNADKKTLERISPYLLGIQPSVEWLFGNIRVIRAHPRYPRLKNLFGCGFTALCLIRVSSVARKFVLFV
jgi:hypothetical protein